MARKESKETWPELSYQEWRDSCQTLHRWLQIAGKIRLSKSPWINHGWQSPLYLSARGLTTSLIHDRGRAFSIDFDFVRHSLEITASDGRGKTIPLVAQSVASFYDQLVSGLKELGFETRIHARPNELADDLPFREDQQHCSYDPESTQRFWRILLQVERVMQIFRSRFLGKVSPIHFFWGSLDLAVTRFSGRAAPEHPGGIPHLPDLVTRDAYSHEVSSCGFWPGNDLFPQPAFYSYAYPSPPGFESRKVLPAEAYFEPKLREFILPYETVRKAAAPETMLLDFFQSTYEAAADLGRWDRKALEESAYLKALQNRIAA